MIPKVEFIEGDPPDPETGGSRLGSMGVWPMVVAFLSERPGVWATVTRTDGNSASSSGVLANQLVRYGNKAGLRVNAVSRSGVVYARYLEASDE